jgi:hypothetical protein
MYGGVAEDRMFRGALVLALAGHLVSAQLTAPSSTVEAAADQSTLLARASEKIRTAIRALPGTRVSKQFSVSSTPFHRQDTNPKPQRKLCPQHRATEIVQVGFPLAQKIGCE